MSPTLSRDARRVLLAQALRAFGYGLASVLLGVTLQRRGFSSLQSGMVLTAVVAGTVGASLFVARFADGVGRRRCYAVLYLLLAVSGFVFAFASSPWVLAAVALSGALSTEVVESGPFTSLEQSMLSEELRTHELVRGFGVYNAVASAAGSLGALAAGGPSLVRQAWSGAPTDERFFLVLVPVALAGALVAWSLSSHVETVSAAAAPPAHVAGSRPVVVRLAGLFAMDAFGGGFVVQAFIAYWLSRRFGASLSTVGVVFAAIGVLQTVSFLAAARLGERFGLLNTMVFSHFPSNVVLACVPLAPSLGVAIGLLLARTVLSQMDVPTRQAYVMALVDPAERTAAAAYTNTARYVVRPAGPLLAGAAQSFGLGAPFVVAGSIKGAYDVVLWRWFRNIELPTPTDAPSEVLS